MIRQLMREQFRVQRAYMIWTTALLTLAMALASYAAFVAAQQNATGDYVTHAYGLDGEWNRLIYLGDPLEVLGVQTTLSGDELDTLLADPQQVEAGVVAYVSDAVVIAPQTADHFVSSQDIASDALWSVGALNGDVDWDLLLASGSAPGHGEVALDATWADAHDIAVGDTVRAGAIGGGDGFTFVSTDELTVSALLRTSLDGKFGVWKDRALIGWDSLEDLGRLPLQSVESVSSTWVAPVWLSAQQGTPALEALAGEDMRMTFGASGGLAWIFLLAAGVLTAGLVGMAFAVGRAQAQARLQWIATARVLGARRGSVAAASALESLLAGVVAGAVGTALAFTAISLEWSVTLRARPDALVPAGVTVASWVVAAMVALAIVVAGIIGAVPAFWAARVAPAAALKPVTPLAEARTSRKVPLWPVVVAWTVLAACMLAVAHGIPGEQGWAARLAQSPGFYALAMAASVAAVVTSIALIVEIVRRVVRRLSSRLSRARTPWLIVAGTSLEGRPAAASAPGAVMALAATAGAGIASSAAFYGWTAVSDPTNQTLGPQWAWLGPFAFAPSITTGTSYRLAAVVAAVVSGLLVLVALAAHLSDRLASASEERARAALGLDDASARLAGATRFSLPLVVGVAVGGVLGIVGACALFSFSSGNLSDPDYAVHGPDWALLHVSHALVPVAVVLVPMLAMIALGAVATAFTVRTPERLTERIAA
ncbi:hypothetical protein [Demequina zhanjiangensis]|uniref:ABC transport system permease protein n=1 Tax=Demequina zhanjiangensis TaxID=3051659 RepID=A0ABT8FZH3_9MICO|nr:hypothetical protein [Demequina sp. SYSU T00b26]MDN4472212.1 hypothetical protein [Demequina sp. SYSU T00b26]